MTSLIPMNAWIVVAKNANDKMVIGVQCNSKAQLEARASVLLSDYLVQVRRARSLDEWLDAVHEAFERAEQAEEEGDELSYDFFLMAEDE